MFRVEGVSTVYGDEQVYGDYLTLAEAKAALIEAKEWNRLEPRDGKISGLHISGDAASEPIEEVPVGIESHEIVGSIFACLDGL